MRERDREEEKVTFYKGSIDTNSFHYVIGSSPIFGASFFKQNH